jgi:hypothetical protein
VTTKGIDAGGTAAAEQALRSYLAAVNEAASTGDASALERLATSACATCQQYAGTITSLAAQGQKMRGGELAVSDITVEPGASAESVSFHVKAATKAGEVVGNGGKVESTFKATPSFAYKYTLDKRDGAWIVVSGTQVPK